MKRMYPDVEAAFNKIMKRREKRIREVLKDG